MEVLWDIPKKHINSLKMKGRRESRSMISSILSYVYMYIFILIISTKKILNRYLFDVVIVSDLRGRSTKKKNKVKKLEGMRSVAAWQIKHLKNFG